MKKREIQKLVETSDGIYLLFIDYEEGDAASAVGSVYRTDAIRGAAKPATQILASSDTLRAMWASPSGALWVGSADGNVGTNATVSWSRAPNGVTYQTLANSSKWVATELPVLRSNRLPPNIIVIWGLDDSNVYAGAYGGHIYHWDGQTWAQVFEGQGRGMGDIRAFDGTSPSDVYGVGADATILHFDGQQWHAVAAPAPVGKHESYTGVHCADGGVFVSAAVDSDEGRLLHGGVGGFSEIAKSKAPLLSMAAIGDRLLFTTGDDVAELIGHDIQSFKAAPQTLSITAGKGRAFVLEAAQTQASFIEYDPRHPDKPWRRLKY